MARITPFLLLVFVAATAIAAPVLVADAPTFDFGTVAQGKKVEHVFTFRNTGDQPLTIGRISSSCGCTAASASSTAILPGKSGEIRVVFDSANFTGAIRKTVSFETNDPRRKTGTFALTGTVAELLPVRPRQVSVGAVKPGTRKEGSFTVENKTEKTVTILSVTSQTPQIAASTRTKAIKPGQAAEITIVASPRSGDRYLNGYVSVKTDNATKPEIRVPVFGTVSD